jgi:endonuclease YncB( thermonuclease family)
MKKFALPFALIAMILVGCQTDTSSVLSSLTPNDLNTAQTDALKLTANFAGKNFITDGIGEVTLRSTTDGDTARFNVGNTNIALRFLGINTPESTGRIEPWGNEASAFTKEKLMGATRIVLINDVSLFGLTDSAGSRYLGFVWYQPQANADFRLLNLELVEQAYSQNLLFVQSTITPYFDAFKAGGEYAQRTGARIYGSRNDPSFDYTDTVYDVSIRFIRKAFGNTIPLEDKYGNIIQNDNDESVMITMSNSTKLRIQAVVVATIGSNLILRDVFNADLNGQFASIYLFTQFTESPFKRPGDVIEIYLKATTFNENVQLTDPVLQTFHMFFPLKRIADPTKDNYQDVLALNGMTAEAEAYDISEATITNPSNFAPFNGFFISAVVTIRPRPTSPEDDLTGDVTLGAYFRKDTNNNMTIYSYFAGTQVSFNLRVDGRMFPYVSETRFALGQSYRVSGYLAPYFDNYQIQLHNGVTITLLD